MMPLFHRVSDLEKFLAYKGLRQVTKREYKGHYIYIAETDLETNQPKQYPWGYYQTAWFVSRPDSQEKLDGGSWLEFDAMHDKEEGWTQETKRMARHNAAYQEAVKWLESNFEVKRYA